MLLPLLAREPRRRAEGVGFLDGMVGRDVFLFWKVQKVLSIDCGLEALTLAQNKKTKSLGIDREFQQKGIAITQHNLLIITHPQTAG